MIYWLFGIFWVFACLVIGVYVTGEGYGIKISYSAGIKAIFISYVIGLALLFWALTCL